MAKQRDVGLFAPPNETRDTVAVKSGLRDTCCVSVQGLHPSEEHFRANYVTMPCEGCPNLKARPDAAHRCSFFSQFLEDALLRSFVASHIPRFFARLKKKTEREKMATSRGVDHYC